LRNQEEPEAPTANLLKIKEKAKCQRLQGKTGEQRAKQGNDPTMNHLVVVLELACAAQVQ
jgi:hypothetical protein